MANGAIPFTDPAHCLFITGSQCPNTLTGFTPMVGVLVNRTLTTVINNKFISKSDRYPLTAYFIIFPEIFWKVFRETFYFGAIKPSSTVLTRSRWRDLWVVRGNWDFLARKARCHYTRVLTFHLFLTFRLRPVIYHLLNEALIYHWIDETEYNILAGYCLRHPGEVLKLVNLIYFLEHYPPLTIRRAAWWRLRARALP